MVVIAFVLHTRAGDTRPGFVACAAIVQAFLKPGSAFPLSGAPSAMAKPVVEACMVVPARHRLNYMTCPHKRGHTYTGAVWTRLSILSP